MPTRLERALGLNREHSLLLIPRFPEQPKGADVDRPAALVQLVAAALALYADICEDDPAEYPRFSVTKEVAEGLMIAAALALPVGACTRDAPYFAVAAALDLIAAAVVEQGVIDVCREIGEPGESDEGCWLESARARHYISRAELVASDPTDFSGRDWQRQHADMVLRQLDQFVKDESAS